MLAAIGSSRTIVTVTCKHRTRRRPDSENWCVSLCLQEWCNYRESVQWLRGSTQINMMLCHDNLAVINTLLGYFRFMQSGGYGRNFQKSVLFAKCKCYLARQLPLQSSHSGRNTSGLRTPAQALRGLSPLFPPLARASWHGFSHHSPAQGPSRTAWLFAPLPLCLQNCGALEKPHCPDHSHLLPGLQVTPGVPEGRNQTLPGFPPTCRGEWETQGCWVRRQQDSDRGRCETCPTSSRKLQEKESQASEQLKSRNGIGARSAESFPRSVFYSMSPRWLPSPHSPQLRGFEAHHIKPQMDFKIIRD